MESKQAAPAAEPKKAKPKKKWGFLKGILIFFVVLLLVIGAVVANALGLPRKWGLVPSKAESVFDTKAPDRVAAAELKAEVAKAGIATTGMEVIVLPEKSGQGSAAYVVLDASRGFQFASTQGGNPFLNTLAAMAKSEAAKKNGIDHAAFEYRDGKGRSIAVFAVSTKDAADFADGKMTREQFMAKVGGRIDIANAIAAAKELQGAK